MGKARVPGYRLPDDDPRHASISGYAMGCTCDECSCARSIYDEALHAKRLIREGKTARAKGPKSKSWTVDHTPAQQGLSNGVVKTTGEIDESMKRMSRRLDDSSVALTPDEEEKILDPDMIARLQRWADSHTPQESPFPDWKMTDVWVRTRVEARWNSSMTKQETWCPGCKMPISRGELITGVKDYPNIPARHREQTWWHTTCEQKVLREMADHGLISLSDLKK